MAIQQKTFTAGSVLTAADVNDYLMEQAVIQVDNFSELSSVIAGARVAYVSTEGVVYIFHNGGWHASQLGQDLKNFQVGSFYGPDVIGRSTGSGTLNRLYYVPFMVTERQAFDRIGVSVNTGAASTTARLGIYTNNPNTMLPEFLHTNGGAVNLAGGSSITTVTINATLNPGMYWLACRVEGAVSAVFVTTALSTTAGGKDFMPVNTFSANMPQPEYYDNNTTSGSLPAAASVNTAISGTRSPILYLRAA